MRDRDFRARRLLPRSGYVAAVGIAGLFAFGGAPGAAQAGGDGPTADPPRVEWGLVVHGGAGTIRPGEISAEREAEYRAKVAEALRTGHAVLAEGGRAVDAVVAAITILEDSPLFNAGKGAVFTSSGTNELDASIMNGADRNAGAVAGVRRVKNPILLARAVMEESSHVMFARDGAEAFAEEQGIEMVEVAHDICARVSYTGSSVGAAARRVIMDRLVQQEVLGGVVAMDAGGEIAMAFNTPNMVRGWIGPEGRPTTGMFRDE